MKVVSVVGARPQFVKLGAIAEVFETNGDIEHLIVHTGQHYDPSMSRVFFDDLSIRAPDVQLNVGSHSHGKQTGLMIAELETVLTRIRPDWTLVYGDTNSTLAATLAAVKQQFRVAHLEAGLRSYNRRMPEEHNRVLTDHAADLLLAPSMLAMGNLEREGLAERSRFVGDVMTDICLRTQRQVEGTSAQLPSGVDPSKPYLIATIHRPDNTDYASRLTDIVQHLQQLPVPVVLVAHPRLVDRAKSFDINLGGGSLVPTSPLSYPQLIRAVISSVGVVTDSGGLQKESFLLQQPCTTLRTETEWTETLDDGWNILDSTLELLSTVAVRPRPSTVQAKPYGNGDAAERVAAVLLTAGMSTPDPSVQDL